MARGHGQILSSIWEDADFLALDEREQRMYLFLISQPNLNHAGLLPLTLRRWSRKARELTVAELEKRLAALQETRFVVTDDDTEELLIRTFVRNDGVWRMPKVMAAMVSGAGEISSAKLRRALLAEMDALPLDELSTSPGPRGLSVRQQIDEHLANLRKTLAVPEPTPPDNPSQRVPGTPREGFGKGTEAVPDTPGEPTTRAHARASRAHSPAPAPAPAPAPTPTPVGGLAQEEDIADAELIDERPHGRAPEAAGAQELVGEWLDRTAKRPPQSVIGQTAKQIKQLLADGIEPDDVRRGLARWMAKGLHPSVLPSVVNEVMNSAPAASNVIALPTGQQLAGTDARVASHYALIAQMEAEERSS